jgi:hypothetical protein
MPTASSVQTRKRISSTRAIHRIRYLGFSTFTRMSVMPAPVRKSRMPATQKSKALHIISPPASISRSGISSSAGAARGRKIHFFILFFIIFRFRWGCLWDAVPIPSYIQCPRSGFAFINGTEEHSSLFLFLFNDI